MRRAITLPLVMVAPHPESLLRLHPVEQMCRDPAVTLRRRGVDARWRYRGHLRGSYAGFNPLTSCVYYATHSWLSQWLADTQRSARRHNVGDRLMEEVWFAVHDYFHIWCYGWIASLVPDLGFGRHQITAKNIEAFAFCHLLTEAVATVGLDYWYLSTIDINDRCNIGTAYRNLTVSYRAEHEDEYRQHHSRFRVQHPGFFADLARFYCTGNYYGFDRTDLAKSPRVYTWLSHELSYGVQQRRYTRSWLSYLAQRHILLTEKQLQAPVKVGAPWQKKLMRQIGERLWAKVKNNELLSPPSPLDPAETWRSPTSRKLDFHFVNYNVIRRKPDALVANEFDRGSFSYLFRQFLAQFDFAKVSPELMKLNDVLCERADVALMHYLYRDVPKVRVGYREPRDLFLLN